jgi:hypothetical protein
MSEITEQAAVSEPVDLTYREPSGWTSPPQHCATRARAERLQRSPALATLAKDRRQRPASLARRWRAGTPVHQGYPPASAVAVAGDWPGRRCGCVVRLGGAGRVRLDRASAGHLGRFPHQTAVVLPISVEAYAAYALRCWLGGGQFSRRTTNFARWSAIASLVIGAGAQVAYHLMAAAGLENAPWQITTLVACVPVAVLGLASALAKLVTSDHQAAASAGEAGDQR